MSKRIVISYKEFLFEVLDSLWFEDLIALYKALSQDAYDTEEHWGAPVVRTDRVIERKLEMIWKYINERFPNMLKEYIGDKNDE